MLFRSFALCPHMTAVDSIGHGLRVQGKSQADIAARVAELSALVRGVGP